MGHDALFTVFIALIYFLDKEIQKLMASFQDIQTQLSATSQTVTEIGAKVDALKTALAAAQLPAGALTAAEAQTIADTITAVQAQLAAVSAAATV